MPSKFWRTQEFETLNKEWTQKLEESGFKDIEEKVGGDFALKQQAAYAYRANKSGDTELKRETKLAYFLLLDQRLSEERDFDDASDEWIMRRTADGASIKEISIELKNMGFPKFNRDTIRYIRRRYEHKWGIKTWKPEDMVSRRIPIR